MFRAAVNLNRQIEELNEQKLRYDRIAHVLYETGVDLEESVAYLLEELGLTVKRQQPGANIDLIGSHSDLGIGFAFEVTGTKGIIRKDSSKILQAWKYLNDRAGTPQERDRIVIVANTQYHLDPKERDTESFTQEVIELLSKHEVLLMSTLQLYDKWKAVYEGKKSEEDVVIELHKAHGLYRPS